MDCSSSFLPYETTGFFSKIVIDYLNQHENLSEFYLHTPDLKGLATALEVKKLQPINREVLVNTLKAQYIGIGLTEAVQNNINSLSSANTFSVTTAHQPNIFTGPLYFIYKIIHTIKLAEELSQLHPENNFVPIYYMGSEDADLDELGYANIGDQHLVWETKQTGAVGRMKVDKHFIRLIDAIRGQIGVLPFGNELAKLFSTCYTESKTIQQATLELVNALFGEFGLVVLIPDNRLLKAEFANTMRKELTEQFSQSIVEKTTNQLQKNYKVQAAGRPINLFYLLNDKRERIELIGDRYEIVALEKSFSQPEILAELSSFPERFSPNVILRGAFQETILPNIAFIGGGGELAYWLELKELFKTIGVAYPVLVLRNSFLLLQEKQARKLKVMGIDDATMFQSTTTIINKHVKVHSSNQLELGTELKNLEIFYQHLLARINQVDASLGEHIIALQVKAIKQLKAVEKKVLRAEKRKFETDIKQIQSLKTQLFPMDNLQERHANFSNYYAQYGREWINHIYHISKGMEQQFGILILKD
ncbi:MAG: bacillithiol biosynthesis cysteine-adding enzyme BshC [Sphingobacteriia bacterium]|nr:MAG: bacillithiol biosynthesis cysteine-adding enzyme BshC [Sphingobacteriia bacterium]TAG30980.1 MAG: bacillithiol biosynthesis cysteine-adding enzyme BshC [Sphingobacteriia bacterium]